MNEEMEKQVSRSVALARQLVEHLQSIGASSCNIVIDSGSQSFRVSASDEDISYADDDNFDDDGPHPTFLHIAFPVNQRSP